MTDDELEDSPEAFAIKRLGMKLYPWQGDAVAPLERAEFGKRINITCRAPNGSGKDQRVIPTAVYYFLSVCPKGRVLLTTGSDSQLDEQTLINLDRFRSLFQWPDPTRSPRYVQTTPSGGRLTAFVTNTGNRIEGWHEYPDSPLLIIVNEAASVPEELMDGLDRCTPTVLMYISRAGVKTTPGLRNSFYESFHGPSSDKWIKVVAGLADCPHISQEKIDIVIAKHGADSPITRSMLYGEWMEQPDDATYFLSVEELQMCLNSPPPHRPGLKFLFCDFSGGGGAENVIYKRDGNKYELIDAWKEKNEDAIVGKFVWHFRQSGLPAEQIGGDAAAKSILDKLAQSGWAIRRQSFGATARNHDLFTSWSAEAWYDTCQKIRNREIILDPKDEIAQAQALDRRLIYATNGKMSAEDKIVMSRRGAVSPDRFDALVGACHQIDLRLAGFDSDDGPFRQSDRQREIDEILRSVGANAGM